MALSAQIVARWRICKVYSITDRRVFEHNTTQTCIKWDTFKAFLRGHSVSNTGLKLKKGMWGERTIGI